MKFFRFSLFLIGLGLLAGCADSGGDVLPQSVIAIDATATLLPTPTLVVGLPTAPPPPPIAAPGVTPDTPTPTATATPTATPTVTPVPAERIELGQAELTRGDFTAAVAQFEASLNQKEKLSSAQQEQTLYTLGVTYLQDGRFPAAADTFNQLLALTAGQSRSETYFYLGQANAGMGDHQGAVGAYQTYVAANPEMAAYISPFIGAAYQVLGDRENTIAAYEAALAGIAHRLTLITIHRQLADFYLADGEYETAVSQYDAIRDLAQTENTKGEMTYLAGQAEILAGNVEAGYARYLAGVTHYPHAYESYLGLVALVEAGYPVDEFQRGLVDYYADMFEPAVAAFARYMETNSETYRPDTHLYLAWSYEGLGDYEAALAELDKYGVANPAQATIERAKMQARVGDYAAAVDGYLDYLASFPEGEDAPLAAWWAAALTERLGDVETAVTLYQNLATNYDWHADAPEAWFRAGWLAYGAGDVETAVTSWRQAAQNYPQTEFGGAALFWLIKTQPAGVELIDESGEAEETADLQTTIDQLIANSQSESYYALRARDVVDGIAPFPPVVGFTLPVDETAGQAEAETWLRDWLGLQPEVEVGELTAVLADDPRRVVGEKLWQLGLFEQAKLELESVRRDNADDALHSYQLALYFRDLGLYRSSIIAASSVLVLSGQTVFDAPKFMGRLAYPIYYADLILPLAQEYGYDPVLQFALVRQESLFESFAHSGAAAQGLAQVIPDTGAYIAQRLGWPNYENDDLYKPYVGLTFGAYYLAQQLRAFEGQVHVALSAYNAGPGNAARWVEVAGDDHDRYLETVNFPETRLYIERIYVGYVIYRYLYS